MTAERSLTPVMTFGHLSIGPAYARASITPGTKHHHDERGDLHQRLRSTFVVLQELYVSGAIGGYGVATWSGFDTGAFTVAGLVHLAEEVAGRPENRLRAIQLPVSMVKIAPVRQSLEGSGPIAQASQAGLEVWASAPFHGGELLPLITPKLAEAVQPGASRVDAALKVAASAPGLTGVLISTANSTHYAQAVEAIRDPVPDHRLKELCDLLDPPAH